ncbi:putative DNA-binding pseudobarrel domain superfamily [Helianthus anomalus]
MDNTIPNYPVVIRGPGKHKVSVRMDVIDNQLYITTGWDRIKKKLSLSDEHLLVFEMIDLHTFDMSILNCSKDVDLVLPPELYVAIKEEVVEELISISDGEDVDDVTKDNEAEMLPVTTNDETIPVVFRMSLKIIDADGNVWDVRVGIESPDGRFYIKDMKQFVKDKKMVPREESTLKFVMGKGIFLFD